MKTIVGIALLVLLLGCSSGKKSGSSDALKNAPAWAKQTPNDPFYYHGVGMASKTGQVDFRERARQSALSEMAGNISVNISSSSVLNQFEFDRTYSEYFRDNIKMTTQQQLEGFELVENWENDQQYWVYYRLSKARWEQIKQDRINKALGLSQSKFEQARTFGRQGNSADALRFYIRSVEDIRDFLGEDLKATIDNEEKPYATALMAGLIDQVQQLKVVFPHDKIVLKPGTSGANTQIEATLLDENQRTVAGIPIITKFSWLPGTQVESVTDARGNFSIISGKIDSRLKSEQITSCLNMDKLVRDNTSDMMVRKLFDGVKVNSFVLPVEIIPPVFFISINEKNLNNPIVNTGLEEEIIRLLKQDGYEIAMSSGGADYSIFVESNTTAGSERNNRFSSSLRATFLIKDQSGKTLFNKTIDDVSGLGSSYMTAGEDAYRSLLGKYRINFYPEIVKTLF
ncbi:MAG: LPP20 family lipoprotein [Bacteroidales bacterium]|nr:LPP20 family lipoprotein [Bacteroidales bacterium]